MAKIFITLCLSLILIPLGLQASELSVSAKTLNEWRAQGGFTQDLILGSKGFQVYVLKSHLASIFPELQLKLNSVFDRETLVALALYQIKNRLPLTGVFSKVTRAEITHDLTDELCNSNDTTIDEDKNETNTIALGRDIALPDGYAPKELVVIPSAIRRNGIICLEPETLTAFTTLYNDAKASGVYLSITSGYRRPEIQQYLKELYFQTEGASSHDGIADPGHSEHQLGTAVDLAVKSHNYASTDPTFGNTMEAKWLSEHAYQYGFVLSYPKDKELVTGYEYEPWHWRYIGVDIAKKVKDSGQTLIEILSSNNTAVTS